ncbi:MAG: SusE domain-containing protein [Saprospiraceae bacterium]
MKKIVLNISYLVIATLLISSCKKEEDQVVFDSAKTKVPTLSVSAASVTLIEADNNKNALTFSFNAADYGFNAGPIYKLQVDKKGNGFKTPNETTLGNALIKSYTVKELNKFVLEKLSAVAGVSNEFEARIKSDLSSSVSSVYSNTISFAVVPYYVVQEYPEIYVPGSYQGWSPDKAERLAAVNYDDIYEGYINFPDKDTEFKFTPLPTWDKDWGDDGSKAGKLKVKGDNIKVADAGYYRIIANVADTTKMTYSVTKTVWSVIGDATAATGGWDNDKAMTYDPAKKIWTVTLDLIGGKEMKFRANGAWDINYGDGTKDGSVPPDGALDFNEANIKIAKDGNYTVTLNLGKPGNYSYSFKKN